MSWLQTLHLEYFLRDISTRSFFSRSFVAEWNLRILGKPVTLIPEQKKRAIVNVSTMVAVCSSSMEQKHLKNEKNPFCPG